MDHSNQHDEIIGRALAKANRIAAPQACPELEELAELCEGTLPAAARDRLLAHLAGCEHCLQVYLVSRELTQAEAQPQTKPHRPHRRWLWVPALASAALLLLFLHFSDRPLTQPTATIARIEAPPPAAAPPAPQFILEKQITAPKPRIATSPRPTGTDWNNLAAELARSLSAATPSSGHAGDEANPPRAFGFAEELGPDVLAFRAGRQLFWLEAALLRDERPAVMSGLDAITGLLGQTPEFAAALAAAHTMHQHCDTATELSTCRQSGPKIVAATPAAQRPLLFLGSWTAAAELALGQKDLALFPRAPLPDLAALLPVTEQSSRQTLEEIERLGATPQLVQANQAQISELLATLRAQY